MISSESNNDSEPLRNMNSDNKAQNKKSNHFYTDQEIESLISTDFCLKADQTLRKAKDEFVEKVKDDLIEYITNVNHIQKNEVDDINTPSITQETSNNYFSHQEEEQQIIEEEEEVSVESNDINTENVSIPYEEEENQNEFHEQSDIIPSGIFNNFADEEEEKSKFEFEDFSQIPQDFPPEELSQIEKVKHYGSEASNSQISGEEELHSVNFLSNNNDDINLSPIDDNKSDENHPAEMSSASHISGGNGFDDFGSDAILDEFGD